MQNKISRQQKRISSLTSEGSGVRNAACGSGTICQDPLRFERGYSLVEIAVSLFVVGVVLLIYAAASQSVKLNGNSKHQQIANRIAASEVEDLKHGGFGNLPSGGTFLHPLLSTLPSGGSNLTVSDIDANMKQVTVTVSWREQGSSNIHQVTLTTIIAKHGL